MLGAILCSVMGALRGSRKDVGGIRRVFVRVGHHGPLRLAPILWVAVERPGQVDVLSAGVPDR